MKFFNECANAIKSFSMNEYKNFEKFFNDCEDFILLGNGGSNSVASHIAQDLTKRGGKRAIAFTDPSMLTCFINDYGMDFAYTRFLEFYSTPNTGVILISSSGNSKNLVNCVRWCEQNSVKYGILTAFEPDNMMRSASKNAMFDCYIETTSYGVAECMHQTFLHGIVECSE